MNSFQRPSMLVGDEECRPPGGVLPGLLQALLHVFARTGVWFARNPSSGRPVAASRDPFRRRLAYVRQVAGVEEQLEVVVMHPLKVVPMLPGPRVLGPFARRAPIACEFQDRVAPPAGLPHVGRSPGLGVLLEQLPIVIAERPALLLTGPG